MRRGILIQSLTSNESSESPGLLELVLSRASQLVGKRGGLGRVFSQATGGETSTTDQAIYAVAEEGRSVGAILDYITATSSSPFNRALASLLKTAGVKTKITVGGSNAYTLLSPGGRIVAIMGEGVFFGQDKKAVEFREWLESVGGTSEKLPDGSFLDPSLPVNTAVNARMVVIDKPDTATEKTDSGIALLSPSLGRVDADKVDVATARAVVSGLLAGWRNAPNSSVVATASDLPVVVREELANQGEKTARGVYHGGTFYLVADEHSTEAEIEETVFHEVWAHYGLRSMFGAQTTTKLAAVFDAISASGFMGLPGKDAFRAFSRRHAFETAQTEAMLRKGETFDTRFSEAVKKRILVEELIAKVQEKGAPDTLKRKALELIGAIREWLRTTGTRSQSVVTTFRKAGRAWPCIQPGDRRRNLHHRPSHLRRGRRRPQRWRDPGSRCRYVVVTVQSRAGWPAEDRRRQNEDHYRRLKRLDAERRRGWSATTTLLAWWSRKRVPGRSYTTTTRKM